MLEPNDKQEFRLDLHLHLVSIKVEAINIKSAVVAIGSDLSKGQLPMATKTTGCIRDEDGVTLAEFDLLRGL